MLIDCSSGRESDLLHSPKGPPATALLHAPGAIGASFQRSGRARGHRQVSDTTPIARCISPTCIEQRRGAARHPQWARRWDGVATALSHLS